MVTSHNPGKIASLSAPLQEALDKGLALFEACEKSDLTPEGIARTETLRAEAIKAITACIDMADAQGISGLALEENLTPLNPNEVRLNVLAALSKLPPVKSS